MNLTVTTFSVLFSVDTVHGPMLEFHLLHTERKLQKKIGYYSMKLWDMLVETTDKLPTATVKDQILYGNLFYTISADDRDELEKALQMCNDVIPKWRAKYNIAKMTRDHG